MTKAVFLDRDGVLCEDTHYITDINQIIIYDFAKIAVDKLKHAGYLTIVITNQSAVARNMVTEEKVIKINDKIKELTNVDDIYYCPHLPPIRGRERIPYNIECDCRKPKPGMILRAISKYQIDVKLSYMIGDRTSDILAGKNAGVKTAMVLTGKGKEHVKECDFADAYFSNLLNFANEITKMVK